MKAEITDIKGKEGKKTERRKIIRIEDWSKNKGVKDKEAKSSDREISKDNKENSWIKKGRNNRSRKSSKKSRGSRGREKRKGKKDKEGKGKTWKKEAEAETGVKIEDSDQLLPNVVETEAKLPKERSLKEVEKRKMFDNLHPRQAFPHHQIHHLHLPQWSPSPFRRRMHLTLA